METLVGRIVLAMAAILFVFAAPSLAVMGGWYLVGLVPETARDAIMALMPYGIAAAVWAFLTWICIQIAVRVYSD